MTHRTTHSGNRKEMHLSDASDSDKLGDMTEYRGRQLLTLLITLSEISFEQFPQTLDSVFVRIKNRR